MFCPVLKDRFRKPSPGVWDLLTVHFNGGERVDLSSSFYVGDAAGRPGDNVGNSDRAFAEAVGVRFATETSFFKPGASHPFQAKDGGE